MCTVYANNANADLAGPRFVGLWIDVASHVRPDNPLPAGLDKILWQAGEHVYWIEMTEPTFQILLDSIDCVLERGFGYRALVGAMKQGTSLLFDDPEAPLPLAEMIPISDDTHVRIRWTTNTQSEPMDLLFYGQRGTDAEEATPAPVSLNFGIRNNRGTPPDGSQDSNASDDDDSDGHQLESSAAAAKRTASWRTTRSRMKNTRAMKRRRWADVDESESDSDVAADTGSNPATPVIFALRSGFSPSPGKQTFIHLAKLDTRAFRPSRHIGRETNRKTPFELPSRTAVSRRSKHTLAAITELNEPNRLADPAEPPRQVVRRMPAIDYHAQVEPEGSHGVFNLSQHPTKKPSPPISPSPLASNPSHDLAPAAVYQLEVRASAEHLLMLASGVAQPAEMPVTQAGTPGRSPSPYDTGSGNMLANRPVPDTRQESGAASPANESSGGYATLSKLLLQLPGFPSTMLVAEMYAWSPLRSVSVLA